MVSVASAVERPSDVYCVGEYAGDPLFYSFKVQCSQGKVYEDKTGKLMPSPKVLTDLQKAVVSEMKGDGYQVLESLRGGQIVIFKKPAPESPDDQNEVCLASSVDTRDLTADEYPYSVVLPGAIVDCSKNTDIALENTGDNDEVTVVDVMAQSGFRVVSEMESVKIYAR
jgi:hypothetical protein